MIVLVGNEKGGTGKTTVAANLAAMCAYAGKETLLVDTDRQESAADWAETRAMTRAEQGLAPDLTCVNKIGKVGFDLEQLRSKFDVIVVDAGGRDSVELRQAMAVCDVMVIPIRPSQFDTWSVGKMAKLIQEVEEKVGEKISAKVVLNAVSTNPSVREAEEVRGYLTSDFHGVFDVLNTQIGDRISFRRAARDGMSVVDLSRSAADQAAVDEMSRVFKEIFNEQWKTSTARQTRKSA